VNDAVIALLAIDPRGLGGVVLRAAPGEARDAWLDKLRGLSAAPDGWRRVPAHVAEDRLTGGLDLAATLASGRPVQTTGLLREAAGGVVLAMAERAATWVVASVIAAIDDDALPAVVALDESADDEPPVAAALAERLAFRVTMPPSLRAGEFDSLPSAAIVRAARDRLAHVQVDAASAVAVCSAAEALGIRSARAEIFTLRAARAAAALRACACVEAEDLALAAALVLAPRATRVPMAEPPPEQATAQTASPEPPNAEADEAAPGERPLADVVLESARAAVPDDVLHGLDASARGAHAGRRGAVQPTRDHGHRVGARKGDPRRDGRLDLLETIRSAAPWQRLRGATRGRIAIRTDDFRVQRRVRRTGTTLLFLVDASGSAAMHRLAEAKGAVELLLAESYVRRDRVALGAFRGAAAELLLPPTRSLARARRALAGLPGGGGTPLASALDLGLELAVQLGRSHDASTPVLVVLTDGRANIARDGTPGREQAELDARASARRWRANGHMALVLDTGRRPSAFLEELAMAMGARYLPLPAATAHEMRGVIRATALS